jgi:hypothetical protein
MSTQKHREPISIKSRHSCLSPSKNPSARNSPDTKQSTFQTGELTQRIHFSPEAHISNQPIIVENLILRELNKSSQLTYQTVVRTRSPGKIEIEKQHVNLPVKFSEPVTTISVRELQQLQQLQQRSQNADIKLHELTLLKTTL